MKQKNIERLALGTIGILMIPLVAMQFTHEVNWTLSDFVVMGMLIFGTGLLCEFARSKIQNSTHRVMVCVVLVLLMLLIWADLAVGIFNIPGFSGS